jgi:hypothetical protein
VRKIRFKYSATSVFSSVPCYTLKRQDEEYFGGLREANA